MQKYQRSSGFTLIELALVMTVILLISVASYRPVMDSVSNIRFQAVVAEAQENVDRCQRTLGWIPPADCDAVLKTDRLNDWLDSGSYIMRVVEAGVVGDPVDDVSNIALVMPSEDSDRKALGANVNPASGVMTVYPRTTSMLPMMYSLYSKANSKSPF